MVVELTNRRWSLR